METLWSIVVGVMLGAGIYLMMERHLVRFIFGLMIVSNAVNLGIFVAGRLTKGNPPLIDEGALELAEGFANPLPQALILTAIVIGFGLLLFTMILAYRASTEMGTADLDQYRESEES